MDLVKEKKIRKPMTPEALEKLALARAKANEIRTQNKLTKIDEKKLTKLESKVTAIKGRGNVSGEIAPQAITESEEAEANNPPACGIAEKEEPAIEEPRRVRRNAKEVIEEEPPPDPTVKVKKKPIKKKPVVIVEQSSDDEDEFEANDKVIFVKRTTRKKKEEVKEIEMPKPPELIKPPPPLKPQLSQHQLALNQAYNNMNNGVFAPTNRRR